MFVLSVFFSLTYFICSLQIAKLADWKIPHNAIGKFSIKIIRLFRNFYPYFSFKLIFTVIDCIKCPIFVVFSAIMFNEKYITDLTAVVAYMAHYFPIWSGFRNDNRNFIGIIFTGFLLDPITGLSMIFAYLISARSFGHTTIAITSAMLVGMVKTFVHIVFFDNNDYIEAVYFIFFGSLAIYKNRRMLRYLCEKTVKSDIEFYRKKKSKPVSNVKKINIEKKKTKINFDEQKKSFKHGILYRNYKKFYKANHKFLESDNRYENRKHS